MAPSFERRFPHGGRALAPLGIAAAVGVSLAACHHGSDGPTQARAFSIAPLDSATVAFEAVPVRVRGALIGGSNVSGSLDNARLNVARVDDSTVVFLVPDLATGPHLLTIDIGGQSGTATLSVEPAPTIAQPATLIRSVLDTLANTNAAAQMPGAIAAQLGTLVDMTKLNTDAVRASSMLTEVRRDVAALSPADQQLFARFVAAQRHARRVPGSTSGASRRRGTVSGAATTVLLQEDGPDPGAFVAGSPETNAVSLNEFNTVALENFAFDAGFVAAAALLTTASAPALAAVGVAFGAYAAYQTLTDFRLYTTGLYSGWVAAPLFRFWNSVSSPLQRVAGSDVSGIALQRQHGGPSAAAAGAAPAEPTPIFENGVPTPYGIVGVYQTLTQADLDAPGTAGDLARGMAAAAAAASEAAALLPSPPATPPFRLPTKALTIQRVVDPAYDALESVTPSSTVSQAQTVNGVWMLTFSIPNVGASTPIAFTVRYTGPSAATSSSTTYQAELVPTRTAWNDSTDYATVANPNGAWSAGWTATLGSRFNLFRDFVPVSGRDSWTDLIIDRLDVPAYFRNTSSGLIYGMRPNQVSIHPGCLANEFAVLRWTALSSGTYTVAVRFYAGDVGNTDAHVLRNGVTSLFVSQSTSANPTYAGTLALAAGEMLDFVVGTGSDTCNGDTTPLDVTITKQ